MNIKRKQAHALRAPLLALALVGGLAMAAEPEPPSDIWLESRLVTAYTLNEHLNPFAIEVEVVDGVATLSGLVDNAVEHDLAIEIAKGVEGIQHVKDELRVKPPLVGDAGAKPPVAQKTEPGFASQVKDATTTASVKMRLMWNRHTDGLDINVTTSEGVVTLDGTVDREVTRDLANEIAANTAGVRRVENRLQVSTTPEKSVGAKVGEAVDNAGEAISDTWITTKVYAQLDNSDEVDSADVRVTTQDGVVTLTGKVGSRAERERAPEIVADVKGVRGIDNRLEIHERVSQGS